MARKKRTTHSSGMLRKRITIGHDKDGKAIVKAVYGHSRDEVEKKIAHLRIERGMGVVVTDDRTTFHYWADAWSQLAEPSVSAGTWMNYETILKHLSVFDGEKISRITSLEIETFLTAKFKAGYSKRILTVMRGIMSRIFRLARRNHAIMANPCEDVSIPKDAPVAQRQAATPEAQEALWNLRPIESDSPERADKVRMIRLFALIQLSCGLRREEVAALQWRDIDLSAGKETVAVSRAIDFKTNRLKEPKSKAGFRTVPIPDRLLPELRAWKAAQDAPAGLLWVFPYREKPLTQSEFRDLWALLLDELNGVTLSDRIKDGIRVAKEKKAANPQADVKQIGRRHKMFEPIYFTSHQLRHTFATNAIADGVDIRSAQYLMGHATAEMTMKYTHLSTDALSAAREKLNAKYNSSTEAEHVMAVQSGQ